MHDNDADLNALTLMPRGGIVAGHERLNAALRALLIDMSERTPGRETNRASGRSYFSDKWLSDGNLFLLPDPTVRQLISVIETLANRLAWGDAPAARALGISSMWAIISRRGMEGRLHSHAGKVSGAYYVDAGECSNTSGAFRIHDANGLPVRHIVPRDGLLMLFPSGLLHSVARYDSDTPRMVISFNLN
ncbi:putative 2OG-Fe(II) oxygenase [Iodidimonas sp. SYSU 1G8]|uniref:putative 2OG-Fe(II) oxygenase n=1 Tax=Iodidimonas sp. SYSU 1G8 TaxID=3133967 RepID=UPI0031FF196F